MPGIDHFNHNLMLGMNFWLIELPVWVPLHFCVTNGSKVTPVSTFPSKSSVRKWYNQDVQIVGWQAKLSNSAVAIVESRNLEKLSFEAFLASGAAWDRSYCARWSVVCRVQYWCRILVCIKIVIISEWGDTSLKLQGNKFYPSVKTQLVSPCMYHP